MSKSFKNKIKSNLVLKKELSKYASDKKIVLVMVVLILYIQVILDICSMLNLRQIF